MDHYIPEWFLILSLFVPRITLLVAYCIGSIPYNNVPFILDFFAAIFLPRVLVLIYIYTNLGACDWFWVHAIVAIFVYVFSSTKASRK